MYNIIIAHSSNKKKGHEHHLIQQASYFSLLVKNLSNIFLWIQMTYFAQKDKLV
jgi:hypothetical protein